MPKNFKRDAEFSRAIQRMERADRLSSLPILAYVEDLEESADELYEIKAHARHLRTFAGEPFDGPDAMDVPEDETYASFFDRAYEDQAREFGFDIDPTEQRANPVFVGILAVVVTAIVALGVFFLMEVWGVV